MLTIENIENFVQRNYKSKTLGLTLTYESSSDYQYTFMVERTDRLDDLVESSMNKVILYRRSIDEPPIVTGIPTEEDKRYMVECQYNTIHTFCIPSKSLTSQKAFADIVINYIKDNVKREIVW